MRRNSLQASGCKSVFHCQCTSAGTSFSSYIHKLVVFSSVWVVLIGVVRMPATVRVALARGTRRHRNSGTCMRLSQRARKRYLNINCCFVQHPTFYLSQDTREVITSCRQRIVSCHVWVLATGCSALYERFHFGFGHSPIGVAGLPAGSALAARLLHYRCISAAFA